MQLRSVTGPTRRTKKESIRGAALEAVQRLHEVGLLTDSLEPLSDAKEAAGVLEAIKQAEKTEAGVVLPSPQSVLATVRARLFITIEAWMSRAGKTKRKKEEKKEKENGALFSFV